MGNTVIWRERAVDEAGSAAIRETRPELSDVEARVLASRGVTAELLEEFFDPSLARLAAPSSLPGVELAVEVILPLVRDGRQIVVFGDYDADGVCASAILVTTLRKLGAKVEAFVPRRFGEGYGMTEASLKRLLEKFPDVALVITVDNGITSVAEVRTLRERGIAVVVTDHHLPGAELPEADALVNPKVAAEDGCRDLCGAGVAFFLSSALVRKAVADGIYSGGKFGGPLLVLAGLATVTDLMPLQRQNRVLVAQSLANFRACAPLGLRSLLNRAQRRAEAVTARDYAFALGPRINAAGRMSDAQFAYELLMSAERDQADELARVVDNFNVDRKTKEQQMDREAREQMGDPGDLPAVVVRGDDWHLGVAGIVAARILESFHLPVAVAVGDTGSVRAPDGYNVHDALEAASAHLLRFGGHAAAGGFTVKPGEFDGFRTAFAEACSRQRAAVSDAAALVFDGWLESERLTVELHDALCRLEPFGEGNPEPVFGLRNVALADVDVMGSDRRHLSIAFANRSIPRAVWWGHGADAEKLRAGASVRFDLLFTLTTSDYGGGPPHAELRIVAMRPASR